MKDYFSLNDDELLEEYNSNGEHFISQLKKILEQEEFLDLLVKLGYILVINQKYQDALKVLSKGGLSGKELTSLKKDLSFALLDIKAISLLGLKKYGKACVVFKKLAQDSVNENFHSLVHDYLTLKSKLRILFLLFIVFIPIVYVSNPLKEVTIMSVLISLLLLVIIYNGMNVQAEMKNSINKVKRFKNLI